MNISKLQQMIDGKKFTKTSIVKSTGISRPTLDSILDGNDFKVSNLEKIATALNVPVSYFFDEVTDVKEQYTQVGSNNLQAHKIDKVEVSAHHELPSGAVGVTDAVLMERLKAMEALLAEKDERIAELKDRISDLKSPSK